MSTETREAPLSEERRLDLLVHQYVLNRDLCACSNTECDLTGTPDYTLTPRYHDGEQLAEIVTAMHGRGYSFACWSVPIISSFQQGVFAVFKRGLKAPQNLADGVQGYSPLLLGQAVSRAALAALQAEGVELTEKRDDVALEPPR